MIRTVTDAAIDCIAGMILEGHGPEVGVLLTFDARLGDEGGDSYTRIHNFEVTAEVLRAAHQEALRYAQWSAQ